MSRKVKSRYKELRVFLINNDSLWEFQQIVGELKNWCNNIDSSVMYGASNYLDVACAFDEFGYWKKLSEEWKQELKSITKK